MNSEELNTIEDCACPMPVAPTKTVETKLTKGSYVLFNRNGKVKAGKVISKGGSKIGLDVIDMKSNTKIEASTELVPMTIFVTKEVMDTLTAL